MKEMKPETFLPMLKITNHKSLLLVEVDFFKQAFME
jgi:hypothetical protein